MPTKIDGVTLPLSGLRRLAVASDGQRLWLLTATAVGERTRLRIRRNLHPPRPSTMPRLPLITAALALACGPAPADPEPTSTSTTEPTPGTTSTTAPDSTTTGPAPTTSESPPTPDLALGDCDAFAQDCPVGQKCVPFDEMGPNCLDASTCVDIIGDGVFGDPCTLQGDICSGRDDCALGFYCWNIDSKNEGTCYRQCSGSIEQPACPPELQCYVRSDFFALCFPQCEPLAQDCLPGNLCIPDAGDNFTCAPDTSGDGGQLDAPCELPDTCDPGLLCLAPTDAASACDPMASGCCQPFCEFPDGPCPHPDQQCLQWYNPMQPVPPGFENVGICAITH